MIYRGDSVKLENMGEISKAFATVFPEGEKWVLTGIVPKASKGYRVQRGHVLESFEDCFLFMLMHQDAGLNLVLTFAEFESCATDIFPIERPNKIKICRQNI